VQIIRELCREADLEILENDRLVDKLARRGNTYAVGVFEKFQHHLDHGEDHLVLVHPSGMGNLGTIVRTMLGFGHRNLAVIEPAADLFHPRVIRASMGAIFQVTSQRFEAFSDYWGTYAGHTLYPLMTDGEQRLDQVRFESPHAVILGEESSGLEESFHQYGTSVRIPQSSAVDSLNIALSAGICLYQIYTNTQT
jgi:TrmH family RNA methyltransferase